MTHFWMEKRLTSDENLCIKFWTKDLIRNSSVKQVKLHSLFKIYSHRFIVQRTATIERKMNNRKYGHKNGFCSFKFTFYESI